MPIQLRLFDLDVVYATDNDYVLHVMVFCADWAGGYSLVDDILCWDKEFHDHDVRERILIYGA